MMETTYSVSTREKETVVIKEINAPVIRKTEVLGVQRIFLGGRKERGKDKFVSLETQ